MEDAILSFQILNHYAIAVIHDENRNGELDTNMFGIPKEGYGFQWCKVTMSALRFLMLYFHMMGTSAKIRISSQILILFFFPKQSTF
jgi:uncharacterized protein (DUF2141 family)